jgi:hypothetical protein
MRKVYKILTMVALCMMATMGVMAQVTGYAITSNANLKDCYVFSFDTSDPSKVETIWTDTVPSEAAVMATLAGDIFYV